jgi:hypothetical protein
MDDVMKEIWKEIKKVRREGNRAQAMGQFAIALAIVKLAEALAPEEPNS